MAIIDVVKWEINNNEYCHKFPSQDLRKGTQLVVYTGQTAFFAKGGVICDEFSEPGTHTLTSDNIPILGKFLNLAYGGDSPFQAEIWFINRIARLDLKWGTPIPIQLEDPCYKIIVPVRAFGQYGIRISNPRLFLETLIGNMSSFTASDINSYFKGKLMSNLNSFLAKALIEKGISILEINAHLIDISDSCQEIINKYFEKYGIQLVDFSVISINVPQDDPSFIKLKEAKATLASVNLTGKDMYQMQRSFDVMEKAASNTGVGGQVLGMGFGLGIGNAMGGVAGTNLNTNPQPTPPPLPQETTYFVYVNGQQIGGQTSSMILSMLANGQISQDTLVWTQGMTGWMPIKDVPSLNSACPPPIPPIQP